MNNDTNPTDRSGMEGRPSTAAERASSAEEGYSTVVGEDREPSTAITEAVSRLADVDIESLEPLYRSIDPDLVDDFLESVRGRGTLSFDFAGHLVTVHADGRLFIRPPEVGGEEHGDTRTASAGSAS